VGGEGAALADVVIEAIFENVEAKRALYAELEPRMRPDAVLATNTSSIKIEVLAEKLKDPSRLVGIHFFNPVAQMQLVEIVHGAATQPLARQQALWFTRKLDKLPLPCRSEPGFVVNRILMPYINEALFALAEGIPAAVIDRAGTRFGMPVGPIELADVVGLDVALHVGRVLAEAFNRRVPDILIERVQQKKLGRKSGEGFYVWKDGKVVPPVRTRARGTPGSRGSLDPAHGERGCGGAAGGCGRGRGLARCRRDFRDRLCPISRRPAAVRPLPGCDAGRRAAGRARGAPRRALPAGSGLVLARPRELSNVTHP
jgi:3-hydroxyacyl-CoA dehydrogenase